MTGHNALDTARKTYCAIRRAALLLSAGTSLKQFDDLVRSALPANAGPVDWCQKATQLLTLMKANADEANRVAAQNVSDYFGQAGSKQ